MEKALPKMSTCPLFEGNYKKHTFLSLFNLLFHYSEELNDAPVRAKSVSLAEASPMQEVLGLLGFAPCTICGGKTTLKHLEENG